MLLNRRAPVGRASRVPGNLVVARRRARRASPRAPNPPSGSSSLALRRYRARYRWNRAAQPKPEPAPQARGRPGPAIARSHSARDRVPPSRHAWASRASAATVSSAIPPSTIETTRLTLVSASTNSTRGMARAVCLAMWRTARTIPSQSEGFSTQSAIGTMPPPSAPPKAGALAVTKRIGSVASRVLSRISRTRAMPLRSGNSSASSIAAKSLRSSMRRDSAAVRRDLGRDSSANHDRDQEVGSLGVGFADQDTRCVGGNRRSIGALRFGQRKMEAAADADLGFEIDGAAELLDDRAANVQAKPGADLGAAIRGIRLTELRENAGRGIPRGCRVRCRRP